MRVMVGVLPQMLGWKLKESLRDHPCLILWSVYRAEDCGGPAQNYRGVPVVAEPLCSAPLRLCTLVHSPHQGTCTRPWFSLARSLKE